MMHVTVNGVELACRVAGDPAHPVMVLLHGLGEDAEGWHEVQAAFTDRYRVYALDLRGHGHSSHPGRYSFELMRDDVIAFLAAAGVERCVLVGHSMGGTVAVLLAEAAPHLVTHLVLEDVTAPRPGAFDRPPLPPPDEPTPFDFAAVNAIRAQLSNPDPAWWQGLRSLAVPTLIIAGATSHIPAHLLTETVTLLPDAALVTLDAGHDVHRDRPDDFVTAITTFLASR
ncbi:alpha/beta fold hydrolase [Actinoplanes sp. N902-109]|uniref:alpha/beta fold hydrolase n=1 Tax=Actinoplanes sp. (strain N902-109) TaxID=649831 RepID=UPI0003294435|nr:alpha/beta fold hydrolase [Actinoplanes sp. N902-109]AGL14529.1 putative hydrolase or acyltransferase of alpha/beta superfamily [Actinoplanes sp. N902-109]